MRWYSSANNFRRGGLMPSSANRRVSHAEFEQPPVYSPDIGPMMHDLLQTLANIDFEYDMSIEKLERSATEPAFKRKIADKLKDQHRERRDPYIRLLAELHNRAMPRGVSVQ
jgi:hypothetical protein